MAWETRSDNRYYYRKRRVGGRVESEYIGAGDLATLAAAIDQVERTQREQDQEAARLVDQEERAIDAHLDQVQAGAALLVRMAALLAGYRPHKGQLRRKRYVERD